MFRFSVTVKDPKRFFFTVVNYYLLYLLFIYSTYTYIYTVYRQRIL